MLSLCVSLLCLVRHVRDHFCHFITKERPVSNAETVLLTGVSMMLKPDDVQMYPTDSVCHDVLTTQMTTLVIKGAEGGTGSISVEKSFLLI